MKELRILVAYDASESARDALKYCQELMEMIADKCQGKYTILILSVEQLPACSLFLILKFGKKNVRKCMNNRLLNMKKWWTK